MLKRELGTQRAAGVDREGLIKFGRDRAKEGAGPVTLSMDIGVIRLVISHAIAVHGIQLSVGPVDMARIALKRLGLVGKSNARDRRLTEDEIERLLKRFKYRSSSDEIPMARIVKFAIATGVATHLLRLDYRFDYSEAKAVGTQAFVNERLRTWKPVVAPLNARAWGAGRSTRVPTVFGSGNLHDVVYGNGTNEDVVKLSGGDANGAAGAGFYWHVVPSFN